MGSLQTRILLTTFWIALAVFLVAICLFISGGVSSSTGDKHPLHHHPSGIPACELEDGSTQDICIWDATQHGNHRGTSVLNYDYGKFEVNMG